MTSTFSIGNGGVNDAALLSTLADRQLPVDGVLGNNVLAPEQDAEPTTLTSLFSDMLSRVQSGGEQTDGTIVGQGDAQESEEVTEQNAKLREAAEMFVSTSMIMPLFQQLRNDPLAADLMHGGRTETIFQQQLDQVLSDRIASATRFDVVDAVYNQLHRNMRGGMVNANG